MAVGQACFTATINMSDPLQDIEDRQAQVNLGTMAARIFMGALEETGSRYEAFVVTAAYFWGMFQAAKEEGGDN